MSGGVGLFLTTVIFWGVACSPKHIENVFPSEPPQEKLSANYESIRKSIFQEKCFRCHRTDGMAKGVSLQPIEDLLNSPLDLVVPGRPEESGLYISVLEGARKKMPPLGSGIPELTVDEVRLIFDWIKNGATD